MTGHTSQAIVLVDQAGDYYVLPRETVEAARVADDSLQAVKALLDGDTEGHALDATAFFVQRSFVVPGGLDWLSQRGIIVVGGRPVGPVVRH